MLQQSTPQSLLDDRAWLDGLMREYKKQGGRINALPGFEFKPRPDRWHPEPVKRKQAALTASMQREREDVAKLRGMAGERYSLRYAAMCAGIGRKRAERLVEKYSIPFPVQPVVRKPR